MLSIRSARETLNKAELRPACVRAQLLEPGGVRLAHGPL